MHVHMRVAVVSQQPPEAGGEAAERLRRTARLLGERGHEVTLFCSRWWDGDEYEKAEGTVRYVAVTEPDAAPWLFALMLPVLLLRHRPEVVYAGYVPPAQVLGAKVASVLGRFPLAVDWYGDERFPGSERTRRFALRWSDRIVVPSRVVETWVRELGGDGDRVTVVPESIDMSLVRNLPTFGDADIVYSRPLDADANLESVLLALAELRERDWSAVVVGDGPERARYEQQAKDLRIDDRVEFVGDQPLEDRVARYRGAHVFVQTAVRESFARKLLWALAAGCVGVVEYQAESSAHELIEHRDRGIRTTNDRELTDAIVSAGELDDRDVDEEFAEYDQDTVVEQYVQCFEDLREEFGLL
jgi:glycosyltransferase involved in cell wall biosynthesis